MHTVDRKSERHQQILKAFQAAVGPENVSDCPATMEAYYGDWLPPKTLGMSMPPEFVVLPAGTKETQAVVKICNRFKVPVHSRRLEPVVTHQLSQPAGDRHHRSQAHGEHP